MSAVIARYARGDGADNVSRNEFHDVYSTATRAFLAKPAVLAVPE